VSKHIPISALDTIDDSDTAYLRGLDQNVYIGTAMRRLGLAENQQGTKHELIALPCISLDIDFADPVAHQATNLPLDLDEASVLFDGQEDPSLIVLSGNGMQPHWLLKEPLPLDSRDALAYAEHLIKQFQAPFMKRAKANGWHLDSTATAQRVWRLPGFVNKKTDRATSMPYCVPEARYGITDLGLTERRTVQSLGVTKDGEELLDSIREALKRTDPRSKNRAAVDKLLAGESFAEPGKRDTMMQSIASTVAWLPDGRYADPHVLARVFLPAFEIWEKEEDSETTVEDELVKAADKIKRAQNDYANHQRERIDELRALARMIGIYDEVFDVDFVLQHALINYGHNYYAYDFKLQRYSHVLLEKQVVNKVRDAWVSAPAGISLSYVNAKGETKQKQLAQIKHEYCTVAYPLVGHLANLDLTESWFDQQTGAFNLVHCLLRPEVVPEYDPLIDEWIRVFAGTHTPPGEEQPVNEWVNDHLALLPQLDKPNCGLYLEGDKETGKTLFALGAARLWRLGGPSDLDRVVREFNEEILQCPLLQIEEGTTLTAKQSVAVKSRALLGQSSFTINPKGLTPYSVNGHIRILICANNANVLDFGKEDLSIADLKAISDRFYHLKVRPEAADWLKRHPQHRTWVTSDKFAKHCLYLAHTRQIERAGRFWQKGNQTSMHLALVMGGETDSFVYEWVIRFASNPKPLYEAARSKQTRPLALIGTNKTNGCTGIFVNTQAIVDHWDTYMHGYPKLNTNQVNKALKKMSAKSSRLGRRYDRTEYNVVEPGMVLEWARQKQVGNTDAVEDFLKIQFSSKDKAEDLIKSIERVKLQVINGGLCDEE